MDHHVTPPAAAADRYPAGPLDALDAADAAFRLLTAGPRPLAVHASRLARGLPDRPVPLDELRVLLLHPATSARARNRVWAELVRRARTGDPARVIGLTGIALHGLRRGVASLTAAYRGDPADLQSEVLTGFLAAVRGLDPDDLEQVPLASRLCWAAWRAGKALAFADAGYATRRRDLDDQSGAPELPWGHPDFVARLHLIHQDQDRNRVRLASDRVSHIDRRLCLDMRAQSIRLARCAAGRRACRARREHARDFLTVPGRRILAADSPPGAVPDTPPLQRPSRR